MISNSNSKALSEKQLSKNRGFYIVEAGLEYLISLLITDAFLAKLLTMSGISDSVAGIVTELSAFAFSAQLVSVFFRKRKGMKMFVTVMHLLNQIMFVLLYLVPVIQVPSAVKMWLIILMFLGGHLISNIISPYKLSWFMSFVPNNTRGRFTANKEIVSLAMGTVFSLLMGYVADSFEAAGKDGVYFAICGITIFVLAVLHMASIVLVKDHPESDEVHEHVSFISAVKTTFSNTALMKIILMDVIWQFSSKLSLAYYGVYKNNVLEFDMMFIAVLSAVSAISRIAFSRFFGKLADKYSWRMMLKICFSIAALAFLVVVFTKPGKCLFTLFGYKIYIQHILFMAYSIIYAVSMAGINSGLMNIIFDYVPKEERAPALGIKASVGGLAAFGSSFLGGYIIHTTQSDGDMLLGHTVYGQQILSAITFVLCIGLILYMVLVVDRIGKKKKK